MNFRHLMRFLRDAALYLGLAPLSLFDLALSSRPRALRDPTVHRRLPRRAAGEHRVGGAR